MLFEKNKFSIFTIITCLVMMVSIVWTPQNTQAASLHVDEVAKITSEYLVLNEKDGTVIIEREVELESRIGKEYFNELVQTLEKLNEVLARPEGEKYKKEIIEEANSNVVSMAKISGCGAATLAGFAHTGAFTGLMTVAGVSGPAGWALGTVVGGVWLAGSAAAGCLK